MDQHLCVILFPAIVITILLRNITIIPTFAFSPLPSSIYSHPLLLEPSSYSSTTRNTMMFNHPSSSLSSNILANIKNTAGEISSDDSNNEFRSTLASSYVIVVDDEKYDDKDDGGNINKRRRHNPIVTTWTAYSIEDINEMVKTNLGGNSNNTGQDGVGELALSALRETLKWKGGKSKNAKGGDDYEDAMSDKISPSFQLTVRCCTGTGVVDFNTLEESSSETSSTLGPVASIRVRPKYYDRQYNRNDSKHWELISILSRVAALSALKSLPERFESSSSLSPEKVASDNITVCVSVPLSKITYTDNTNDVPTIPNQASPSTPPCNEVFRGKLSVLQDDKGCSRLFHDIIGTSSTKPSKEGNDVEMCNLIDSNGQILSGALPRTLIHRHNLLHCGAGIAVFRRDDNVAQGSQERDIDNLSPINFDNGNISLYVHRRSKSKRIFPSLYDMFVGGVTVAGERMLDTAYREVLEELGLDQGKMMMISSSSSPCLYRCTICTSYNRCVVDVYAYETSSNEVNNVKWQKGEVEWGQFVPYTVIKDAASLSIDRLMEKNEWPGSSNGSKDLIQMISLSKNDSSSFHNLYGNDDEGREWKEWNFVPDGLLVWEAWIRWMNDREGVQ